MKPKTKIQMEVWRLHQKLNMPVEHEDFIISKHCFFYSTHYKNVVCLECNHIWKPEKEVKNASPALRCPSCNKQLIKTSMDNGSTKKLVTYLVVNVVDRFQVFRYFSCFKHLSKSKKPTYSFRSLFEEWKDYETNRSVIIGRTPSWSGDGFSWSDYEVRYINKRSYRGSEYERYAADVNCPNPEFLPRFKKYGFKQDFHNCDYRFLLAKIENDNMIETLFKAKQRCLLFHAVHKNSHYSRFWPQIKIAMRHKFKIDDPSLWYDYLQLLSDFRKDIRNPKFILPIKLKVAHNELVAKKRKRTEAIKAAQELRNQQIERERAQAVEELKKIKTEIFKGVSFKQGNIKIVALVDDDDVRLEGEILDHCVYESDYHKKSGILLMSARIDEKRIETIEISLASYSVIQCRGFDNEPTEYHDEIIEIVRKNMRKISKIVEKHKDFQEVDSHLSNLEIEAA